MMTRRKFFPEFDTCNKHKFPLLTGVSLLLILMAVAAAQTTPPLGIRDKTPDTKAFVNGHIMVSPQLELDSAVIVVKEGRIVALGKGIPVPAEAAVIDLAGKTMTPGFIDPFTDYGVERVKIQRPANPEEAAGTQYLGKRSGGDAWNDAIHAEQRCVSTFSPDAKDAREYLKNGITVVQSAKLDGVFRGRGFVTTLGNGLPNDLLLRAESWHQLSFDKGSSKQEYPGSLMGVIAMIRQTLLDVDWYTRAQAAYKLNPNQKKPEYNAALEALQTVKNEKIVFETEDELSLLRADKLAKEFGIQVIEVGSGGEYAWAKEIAATGASLILPVDFPAPPAIERAEDELDVTLGTLRQWEMAPSNPKILADHKVTFAFTSYRLKDRDDFLPNIRAAIKRGLSKQTALAALTVIPAQLCNISGMAGTLEQGKLANFIISDRNPLDEGAHIYSVWVAGKEEMKNDLPANDLRGEYAMTIGSQQMQLSLKGEPDRPRGDIKLAVKTYKLQRTEVGESRVAFVCEVDTLAFQGVLRFSGRQTGDSLSGSCALANGRVVSWKAVRTSSFVEKPDRDQEQSTGDAALVSHLTYPNKAYGFAEQPKAEDVLIRNATVWTSEAEGILQNTDVLVINGKFATVGRGLKSPAGVRVIDGTGKHVTAGVIDAHAHIATSGDINEGTFAITPEVTIADVINPEDISIYRILSGGVTMSNTLHGSANPIGGRSALIKHKWGLPAEQLVYAQAPTTIKFALGENVKQSGWGERFSVRYPQSRMGVETIIKDEFQTAREYERDWAKYRSLSSSQKQKTVPPRKDLGLEAIIDVLHSRSLIHCHAYVASEMLMMMRLAEEFGIKLWMFVHVAEGYKIADEMAKHGAMAGGYVDWWAYKFEVYDGSGYNSSLLAERGVVVGVNSDSPDMARRLNSEAGKTILYGDTKQEEAIKMVTINPARQLGVDKYVGSIKVGKDADFAIWSGNPLSTYTTVEQTWIEGRKYFDRETDKQLREDNMKEKMALIQKVLKVGGDKGGEKWEHGKPDGNSRDGIDIWEGRDEQ